MSDDLEKNNPSDQDACEPEGDTRLDALTGEAYSEDRAVEGDGSSAMTCADGSPSDRVPIEEGSGSQGLEDGQASRERVQNRRAAIAVAIMVLISAVLIGGVKLMYFVAERAHEPAQVGTVVPAAIQRTHEIKAEVEGIEPTEPFYVLLIGSDSRKGTALYTGKSDSHAQVDQHSDVMTLLRVDPVNYVLTFVTIPRDTQLEGENGKICDSLKDGDPNITVEAVERLTGVHIDYYMMIGFVGFEDMVDEMLGVEVDVPVAASSIDPKTAKRVSISPGDDKMLNGSESLVLARERSVYGENQDAYRQVNVRNLEVAIVVKAVQLFDDPQGVSSILDSIYRNVQTDMDDGLIAILAQDFIENGNLITFYSCSGPYEGDIDDEGLWIGPEDKEAWSNLMAAVDAGADPATVIEPLDFED